MRQPRAPSPQLPRAQATDHAATEAQKSRLASAFKGLQVRDATLRADALTSLIASLGRAAQDDRPSLAAAIPTVLRLCTECPYSDVRDALLSFLARARQEWRLHSLAPLSSSAFIGSSELRPRYPGCDESRRLFEKEFLLRGSVPNVAHVLSCHPSVLECYTSTMEVVLHGDGPLPIHWRCYVGLMAASRHSSVYLATRMADEFIAQGGDPEWLHGVAGNPSLPVKLAALAELNALLAHRPWALKPSHIRWLVAGDFASVAAAAGADDAEAGAESVGAPAPFGGAHTLDWGGGGKPHGDGAPSSPPPLLKRHSVSALSSGSGASVSTVSSWGLNELSHVIVILTVTHSLCTLVQALGINCEPDAGGLAGYPAAPTVQLDPLGSDPPLLPVSGSPAPGSPAEGTADEGFAAPSLATPSYSGSGGRGDGGGPSDHGPEFPHNAPVSRQDSGGSSRSGGGGSVVVAASVVAADELELQSRLRHKTRPTQSPPPRLHPALLSPGSGGGNDPLGPGHLFPAPSPQGSGGPGAGGSEDGGGGEELRPLGRYEDYYPHMAMEVGALGSASAAAGGGGGSVGRSESGGSRRRSDGASGVPQSPPLSRTTAALPASATAHTAAAIAAIVGAAPGPAPFTSGSPSLTSAASLGLLGWDLSAPATASTVAPGPGSSGGGGLRGAGRAGTAGDHDTTTSGSEQGANEDDDNEDEEGEEEEGDEEEEEAEDAFESAGLVPHALLGLSLGTSSVASYSPRLLPPPGPGVPHDHHLSPTRGGSAGSRGTGATSASAEPWGVAAPGTGLAGLAGQKQQGNGGGERSSTGGPACAPAAHAATAAAASVGFSLFLGSGLISGLISPELLHTPYRERKRLASEKRSMKHRLERQQQEGGEGGAPGPMCAGAGDGGVPPSSSSAAVGGGGSAPMARVTASSSSLALSSRGVEGRGAGEGGQRSPSSEPGHACGGLGDGGGSGAPGRPGPSALDPQRQQLPQQPSAAAAATASSPHVSPSPTAAPTAAASASAAECPLPPGQQRGSNGGEERGADDGGQEAHGAAESELDPGAEGPLTVAGLRYRDFNTAEGMFVTHDFSWEEHAYMLLQRFYPAAAPVLDKEFRVTFGLTYRTFGNAKDEVDTEPFRTAIWYYIQRLFGVRNDHYNYRLVNQYMTIPTKAFAKKAACFPEAVSASDFNSFTTTFTASEKVHIVLLVMEARRQAALLYGLHALMKCA